MTAIGPVVGGYLTTAMSWRLIFFINLPFAALAAWAAMQHLPEGRDETAPALSRPVGESKCRRWGK
jgi:MFS family permease